MRERESVCVCVRGGGERRGEQVRERFKYEQWNSSIRTLDLSIHVDSH